MSIGDSWGDSRLLLFRSGIGIGLVGEFCVDEAADASPLVVDETLESLDSGMKNGTAIVINFLFDFFG